MPRPEEVEKQRTLCRKKTNDELIYLMHDQIETSPVHVAAKQELEFRKEQKEEQNFRAAMSISRKSLYFSLIATLISLIALGLWIANVFGKFGQS